MALRVVEVSGVEEGEGAADGRDAVHGDRVEDQLDVDRAGRRHRLRCSATALASPATGRPRRHTESPITLPTPPASWTRTAAVAPTSPGARPASAAAVSTRSRSTANSAGELP